MIFKLQHTHDKITVHSGMLRTTLPLSVCLINNFVEYKDNIMISTK